ncbi:MAG: hypothetical protein K6E35_02835 [Bacteroidales bacterium]|nr:hypothetical protein [Bacteroidales bacterium]
MDQHQHKEPGVCLECGKPLHGRKGKQFCSLVCKNAYHNRAQQNKRRCRTKIIAALSRNYSILEALLKEDQTSATQEDLSRLGFDPVYITGHQKNRFRHDEYTCFDIVFCCTDARIFNIRRKAIGSR